MTEEDFIEIKEENADIVSNLQLFTKMNSFEKICYVVVKSFAKFLF